MENKKTNLTPKVFIKTISNLHLFFTFSPLLFGLFVLYKMNEWNLNLDDYSDPFLYIVPVIGFIAVFLSNYLYKKNINDLKNKSSLREKLTGFQSASIISYAPLEGAALLGIVAAHKSPNIFYLIISAILIIYLFYHRPSKDKIEQDLELNSDLKNQFNKSEQTID